MEQFLLDVLANVLAGVIVERNGRDGIGKQKGL